MGCDKKLEQKRLIERDARKGRTYSIADRIGREGSGFLKGASPVSRLRQVQTELSRFVSDHVRDHSGALRTVLIRHIMTNETLVSQHFQAPLEALVLILDGLMENEARYHHFVQEVDIEWGRLMQETPYFQEPGEPAHDDDEYTHESVCEDLRLLRDLVTTRR